MNALKNICQRLANRATFKAWPLQDLEGFEAFAESDAARSLRDFLNLRDTTSDFSTVALASALLANSELRAAIPLRLTETDVVLTAQAMPVQPAVQCLTPNVTLLPASLRQADTVRGPVGWPFSAKLTLKYVNSSAALLISSEQQEAVGTTASDDGIIVVNWPAWVGFNVRLQFMSTTTQWTTGSVVDFIATPPAFPFAAMLEAMEPREDWLTLLFNCGLADCYADAVNLPVDRAGIIAAALVMDTL